MKSNYPLSRKDDIVIQEADGEVLIYDLKDNKAFCLNETSALVWEMCDGNTSVSQISKKLSKKLKSDASEDLVWLAIDELRKEKLVRTDIDTLASFEGMSRREVIKKVGLGTMVALPIVTGLVAPTAVMAQSACTDTTCTCADASLAAGTPCTSVGSGCTSAGCPQCYSSGPGATTPDTCGARVP